MKIIGYSLVLLVVFGFFMVGIWRNSVFLKSLIFRDVEEGNGSGKQLSVGDFSGAVDLIKFYSKIAGFNHERTYLVLMQNSAELRPTGGFIGTYGILKVQNGKINEFTSDDVYNLDKSAVDYLKIDPPRPLKEYFNQEYWFLRDSNWSPDFEESAKQALWFYKQESQGDIKFDGVFAITPEVIKDLLLISGPLTVDEIVFTHENFTDNLQKEVEMEYKEKGIEKENRKEIINNIARELLPRIKDLKIQQFATLKNIILDNLARKNILLYFTAEDLQGLSTSKDWTGKVKFTDGDYLMVVDANLGGYKSDPFVKRNMKYSISPSEDGRLIAEVLINYNHEGSLSWLINRYRTYTRVYAPKGSELLEVAGALAANESTEGRVDILEKFDKTVFGAFTVVPPGESQNLIFRYYLPPNIIRGDYSLLWQKQPGTSDREIILDFDFGEDKKFYHNDKLDVDKFYKWLW